MKIAFVGDSFCMNCDISVKDWPAVVAKTLDAEIIQTGHGGQPFYPPFELFLSENFNQVDYVVLCPSEPSGRIYNRHNLPINMVWVDQITNKKGDHWDRIKNGRYEQKYSIPNSVLVNEITTGAKAYFHHFMTNDFALSMNIGFIMWLDNLLKEHNKKVIWLPSFSDAVKYPLFYYTFSKQEYYIPVSGPSGNIGLDDISEAELVHENLSEEDISHILVNDDRPNHFNIENNGVMANIVLDIIKKDDFSSTAIKMEEYFSHLDLSNAERIR